MSTTWTIVYQPSQFSPHLQPTGDVFATWTEAEQYGRLSAASDERLVNAWGIYLVPADATEMVVDTGRTLKIAPTAAKKAAAKERAARIAKLLADDDACMRRSSGWSALAGFAGRIAKPGDRQAAAEYAADNGMTWSDVCRTQA